MNRISIKKNARILFIGDSITDCGRDKTDRHGLTGYNRLVCERLGDVEGFNRGVNGEACAAILSRLRRECEDIRPDVISVLAGINDTTERGDRRIWLPRKNFLPRTAPFCRRRGNIRRSSL